MIYTFNQYYLITRLTRKAAHDIYLAYVAQEPERKVLLKIYDAQCRYPESTPADFHARAQKFKRLSHPHIVPILDLGIEENKPYVVSDYFPGGSLRQQLARMAPEHMLLDSTLALVLEVGNALSYAHSQNIVHRRVKPENIFLNAQGQALLADFSLYELIREPMLERQPDDGAISYLASEQLAGSGSTASDQYALACLLYELITGKLPFTAHDLSYLWQRYTIPEPTPPSQYVTTIPKELESAILKALSKKPEDRYTDVEAFLAALKAVMRPEPPAFPFRHIIPRTGHQAAVRIPRRTPPPAGPPPSRREKGERPSWSDIREEIDLSQLPLAEEKTERAQPSLSKEEAVQPIPLDKEKKIERTQSVSEEEEDGLSSFPFLKRLSQKLDGAQKAAALNQVSPEQEGWQWAHSNTKAASFVPSPGVQPAQRQAPPVIPPAPPTAPASALPTSVQAPPPNPPAPPTAPAQVSLPFPVQAPPVIPAPPIAPVPVSRPASVQAPPVIPALPIAPAPVSLPTSGRGSRQPSSGTASPPSPASAVSAQKLPEKHDFPVSKRSYILLSIALICLITSIFFASSNNSIVHLLNSHTSVTIGATPVPVQATPTAVTSTPAKRGLQETPSWQQDTLTVFYLVGQFLYLFVFITMLYYFTRPINWVNTAIAAKIEERDFPKIILFYPVLRELEETMRTTFLGIAKLEYPPALYRVIAIPNSNDGTTIASLSRLKIEFPFLEILEVPPTKDPRWEAVWKAWDINAKAYWWHHGKYRKNQDLPPKKTRQLIYAFYTLVADLGDDWLLDYIDADSIPPTDHFMAAAAGMRKYDVLQSTNIAGNLLDTWAASFHAMDHMAWDGLIYPHMSANGEHPFWVLGKGLFYKAADIRDIGSFNPWITIEDPEVGMRLWTNGKKIGIIANPLIEEVPVTLKIGIIQRSRWVCGFFQSLSDPLNRMGMSFWQAQKARLNLVPCLSLTINTIALPLGIWALYKWFNGTSPLSVYWAGLAILNIASYVLLMTRIYIATWQRTSLVLSRFRDRVSYLLRVNPIFLWVYWLIWCIPIVIGFRMFLKDQGREWIRTEKVDANHALVRKQKIGESAKTPLAARR
ncbi:MAG TPA: protein kinase [Ktedonobacteraceae bacterium]|nr:protein kinase [Ktedonobacteraceae bacterium]